jgi:hypothetical protein
LPAVDVATGNGDAAGDLLLDQLEIGALHQPGRDTEMGEGLQPSNSFTRGRATATAAGISATGAGAAPAAA